MTDSSMPAVPEWPTAVDTVFLDAGNTLLIMDHALLARRFGERGLVLEAEAIARAESAARMVVSRHIAGGDSSETTSTREVYIRATLDGLIRVGALESDTELDAIVAEHCEWITSPAAADELWSVVPDDLVDALERFGRAGVRRWVVSNSDGQIERRLVDAGLGEYLDGVIDSGLVGVEKPHRGIFEIALERAGSRPERTVHIGDIYDVDVIGARGAGIHGVLIDPYDDGPEECLRARSVAELATRLLDL